MTMTLHARVSRASRVAIALMSGVAACTDVPVETPEISPAQAIALGSVTTGPIGLQQGSKVPAGEARAIMARPKFAEMKNRLERVTARRPPVVVLVDEPLPSGLLAVVHLNSKGSLGRFVVVSVKDLKDEVIDRAMGAVLSYEMLHEDDRSQITINLYVGGRYAVVSEATGHSEGMQPFGAHYARSNPVTSELLTAAAQVEYTQLRDVGLVRVVPFRHSR